MALGDNKKSAMNAFQKAILRRWRWIVVVIYLRLGLANYFLLAKLMRVPSAMLKETSQQDFSSASSTSNASFRMQNFDTSSEVPRNLRLAFIGDSLTRYMYLSLVHFLRWGYWESSDTIPSMVLEKQHASWNDFFNYTKSKLFPYEECDCWRGNISSEADYANVYENRYYWDPVWNNSITMIQKIGRHAAKGHWYSTDVHRKHDLDVQLNNDFVWNYGQSWADIIHRHLAKLPHKPQYIIFNGGMWQNNGLNDTTTQRSILNALTKNKIIGIYRTTTFKRGKKRSPHSFHDEELCRNTQFCLDVSWTKRLHNNSYIDYAHFNASVYKRMNVQLLDMLVDVEKSHGSSY